MLSLVETHYNEHHEEWNLYEKKKDVQSLRQLSQIIVNKIKL